jgi:SAM-dependent methyltransferase
VKKQNYSQKSGRKETRLMEFWKNSDMRKMFFISFLVLFFELLCLRWFPAQIRHLGYFTNYILMAAFLGIGIGCLWGKQKENLLMFFTPALIIVLLTVYFFQIQVRIVQEDVLYFQNFKKDVTPIEPFYMIPALFLCVTFLFTLLASPMGRLFSTMEAIEAYKANILGSLAGIIVFTALSYMRTPPCIWILLFFMLFLLFSGEPRKRLLLHIPLAILSILVMAQMGKGTLWSPYYKIVPKPIIIPGDSRPAYDIWVNNTGHQMLLPSKQVESEPMYGEIYRHFSPAEFQSMLIIGAGGGRDTSYHLSQGVASIDAVDIDPVLIEFGKTIHPEKPYLDKRVTVFVEDARTFLKRCTKHYDCIIFALPDSLVLSSSYANLRLESYLFTLESFKEARKLLKPQGILVLYNYYRRQWLIDKLAGMLEQAFGEPPAGFIYNDTMACLMAGPGSSRINATFAGEALAPATDDWPFLYLKKPSFPGIYIQMILSVLIITIIFYFTAPRPKGHSFNWAFFFLGAAFMLLETKSIVNFTLLYGSTWLVNSIVFFIILCLVLLAIFVTNKYPMKNRLPLYGGLLLLIALNYCVPVKSFLGGSPILNAAAPVFYLLPVFLANLIFACNFKDSQTATTAYASNMLGAILGGMTEYLSMITGYNSLMLIVAAFYVAAFVLFIKKQR